MPSLAFPPAVSSDGGAESSALVDDNGSEEDFSYEELCQANPRYLQPGGEQLAINEVLRSHTCQSLGAQGCGCLVGPYLAFPEAWDSAGCFSVLSFLHRPGP